MTEHLLAIDAGTTGVTALLFDSNLEPVARAYAEFPQSFPEPGRVEHDARDILAAVDRTVGELAGHPSFDEVVAVGVTNQRETVFALERSTGRALAPGIVWQDRRTEPDCRALEAAGHLATIRARTGLVLDPYFSATKIAWMLRENARVREAHARDEVVFVTVDTLVIAHLLGSGVADDERYVTDATNASRTMLFDIQDRAWSAELCELFGVKPDALARVEPSVAEFGVTDPARTGGRALSIRGVAGDQQAALFGQGGFRPGVAKATFGTGSFLLFPTFEKRVDSAGGLLTTLAAGERGQPIFALEGSTFVCGALVQWLRDELGFFDSSREVEALAASVDDAAGVTIVPAFTGLGAPYWDANARGAILGLTRGTSRAHIARAALEAIALQNAELLELLREESNGELGDLRVDGGAAANDLLMQLVADFGGARVVRSADVEATARGAALLAGVGAGLWSSPSEPAAMSGARVAFEARYDAMRRSAELARWRAAVTRVLTTA